MTTWEYELAGTCNNERKDENAYKVLTGKFRDKIFGGPRRIEERIIKMHLI